MRVFLGVAAMTLLTAAGVNAASFEDFVKSVDSAIGARNDVQAMDLLCTWTSVPGIAEYGTAHTEDLQAAIQRWTTFEHKRYEEVFLPPADGAGYFRKGMPWEQYGFVGACFGHTAGASSGTNLNEGLLVISEDGREASVDLNRDGNPEMTFRGGEVHFQPGLSVSHDDAGDGRRQQWLAAGAGANPRSASSIWVYRDGQAISIVVKPAQGLTCGRSWCVAG